MRLLVTVAAGIIGSNLSMRLLERGDTVIGIDNHNAYCDLGVKEAGLARHSNPPNYTHLRMDLADRKALEDFFVSNKPQRVVNLAAQGGVRHSIENLLPILRAILSVSPTSLRVATIMVLSTSSMLPVPASMVQYHYALLGAS